MWKKFLSLFTSACFACEGALFLQVQATKSAVSGNSAKISRRKKNNKNEKIESHKPRLSAKKSDIVSNILKVSAATSVLALGAFGLHSLISKSKVDDPKFNPPQFNPPHSDTSNFSECIDFSKYISNRKVDDYESKMREIADKFNLIPWVSNNCWISTAFCLLSDYRDIDENIEFWSEGIRFEDRCAKIVKILGNLKDKSTQERNEYLREAEELSKSLANRKNGYIFGKYDDASCFFYSICPHRLPYYFGVWPKGQAERKCACSTLSGPFGGEAVDYFNNVFVYSKQDCLSDFIFIEKDSEVIRIPEKCSCRRIGPINGGEKMIRLDDGEVCRQVLSNADRYFDFKIYRGEPRADNCNFRFSFRLFGLIKLKEFENLNVGSRWNGNYKKYLLSDVFIHNGTNHWYGATVVYDKETLNSDEPKIIGAVRLNNFGSQINNRVVKRGEIGQFLKTISTNAMYCRYRALDDKDGIIAI